MLHLLLAGLVLMSGAQSTTTAVGHGRIDPVRGGTILKVAVQTAHVSAQPPVNRFKGLAALPVQANAIPQYCFFRKNMNGMYVTTFVRIDNSRQNAGCQSWLFWP